MVEWIYSSNIYEVNLRQYTVEGTFTAFMRHMPRLKDMGIEILWFMPITPISRDRRLGTLGSYYACSDYTSTNPEFGTLDDFKQLVHYAHELGLKVVLDFVANHTGWDHHWTRESPDFYRKNLDGHFYDANGWEDVIDLNYDNPALRQAMIDAMTFWVEQCDIDGYRCDMAMLVPLEFWREARAALDRRKKLFWLAECEEIAYHEVFDATYTWKFLHKMESVWRKEAGLRGLDEVLQYYHTMFPPEALRAFFTTNHDENSHSGSEYERMGDAARAFAVLCCTWNGLPLIYSGQELPNYKRLKFFDKDQIDWKGPDGGDAKPGQTDSAVKRTDENDRQETAAGGAGTGAGNDRQGLHTEQAAAAWAAGCELHTFYKVLLGLRKRNPALRAGDPAVAVYRLHTGVSDRCYAFIRKTGEDAVLVLLNFSSGPLDLPADGFFLQGSYKEVFTGETIDQTSAKAITLAAWGYKVFERNKPA